jgi:hypothetical protein
MNCLLNGTMTAFGCFCAVLIVCLFLTFFRFLND